VRHAKPSAVVAAISIALWSVPQISPARSQQSLLSHKLVGTWSFLVTAAPRKDGTKADVFGPTPNGIFMFHPDGHFAMINTRPGRPKYGSGNRLQGTPDEFRETVLGSIAYFGTYSVDEASKEFVLKVKGSTFPDYEGQEQVRAFTLSGDELRSVNPNPSQGGPSLDLVMRRLKPAR
jgi:hypothetical protein